MTYAGGAALAGLADASRGLAIPGHPGDIAGLRRHIEHVIVLFQENRSFDHYFGAYRHPAGAFVAGLLDASGRIDRRFAGLQKNPEGIVYPYLPVPDDIPNFQNALLENLPFHLAPYIPPDYNVNWDPEHHFFRMYAQVDNGSMDRFVALALRQRHPRPGPGLPVDRDALLLAESIPSGPVLGFYERADIPAYHRLADEYVLCDHFFQAMSGGSTCNALYLASARSAVWRNAPAQLRGSFTPPHFDLPYDPHGILINDLAPVNGPTEADLGNLKYSPPPDEQSYPNIGDRLSAADVSWAWYHEGWNAVKPWALKTAFGPGSGSAVIDTGRIYVPYHNPFQYYPSWFENVKAGHIRDSEDFFADARAGKLPSVSFVKASGAHDEHSANSTPRWGEMWVMSLLRAVGASPLWDKTAVIVTYDEGGGFWDHLPPPRPDAYGCGTRVPALLVSPWARRGYVDHRVADTTSILALIGARFGLQPLQRRDARAYNLLDGLNFAGAPREARFD